MLSVTQVWHIIHAMSINQQLLINILDESAAMHKHLCPRQVLGARIGLRGLCALGLMDENGGDRFENGRKKLLTIVETDGCGLDGIAVATDCHVGRRTLRVMDYGKMAATLIDVKSKTAVRISPQPNIRQLAHEYAPNARSRWHTFLEAYYIIPDEELLRVETVILTKTIEEILSKPRVRINCAECGEEIVNEREVLVNGRLLCLPCAGTTYYTTMNN